MITRALFSSSLQYGTVYKRVSSIWLVKIICLIKMCGQQELQGDKGEYNSKHLPNDEKHF